jgi:site-specific recombinase XerD
MKLDVQSKGETPLQMNLLRQLEAVLNHARQGSYETRRRYADACIRFVKWLADSYRVQRLGNLHEKHILAYVETLKGRGLSTKYIETELSAIRWLHDQMPKARYPIAKGAEVNKAIGIVHDSRMGVHREWTERELVAMIDMARSAGKPSIARIMELVRLTGLRLNEVSTLRSHQVEAALRTGLLTVKGKNGKVRSIPLSPEASDLLAACIDGVPRGSYVFCPESMSVPQLKHEIQAFIRRHRSEVQDSDRTKTAHNTPVGAKSGLSIHELRYLYVQEEYQRLIQNGMQRAAAEVQVMEQVGHERRSETERYMAGHSTTVQQVSLFGEFDASETGPVPLSTTRIPGKYLS